MSFEVELPHVTSQLNPTFAGGFRPPPPSFCQFHPFDHLTGPTCLTTLCSARRVSRIFQHMKHCVNTLTAIRLVRRGLSYQLLTILQSRAYQLLVELQKCLAHLTPLDASASDSGNGDCGSDDRRHDSDDDSADTADAEDDQAFQKI